MKMLKLMTMVMLLPAMVAAQSSDTMVVKTISLHHLSNIDAVQLLGPYLIGRGNAFSSGGGLHAITLRGSTKTLADMEKLLAQYDRSPATVTLSFQLVAADNTNRRDPQVAGVDSVLRSVLKFSGYHLLTTAVINVSENMTASQVMSGEGQAYRLDCDVSSISGDGSDASIQLQVSLRKLSGLVASNGSLMGSDVLRTGVSIPIGHTVVLGTSVEPSHPVGNDRALILIVRPQVASTKKD